MSERRAIKNKENLPDIILAKIAFIPESGFLEVVEVYRSRNMARVSYYGGVVSMAVLYESMGFRDYSLVDLSVIREETQVPQP